MSFQEKILLVTDISFTKIMYMNFQDLDETTPFKNYSSTKVLCSEFVIEKLLIIEVHIHFIPLTAMLYSFNAVVF